MSPPLPHDPPPVTAPPTHGPDSAAPRSPVLFRSAPLSRAPLQAAFGFVLFFAFWNVALVPRLGVNEPHWLCKAKHWFDPTYCPGDFFLDSYNAHAVFLWIAGWCSMWLSLETLTIAGRAVAGVCLALGLWRLCESLSPRPVRSAGQARSGTPDLNPDLNTDTALNAGQALGVLVGFALLQWVGNLSGEWVLGGFEAKAFAWAALWFGWGELVANRWLRASAWGGVALSLHPVVGAWGILASLFGLTLEWLARRVSQSRSASPTAVDAASPTLASPFLTLVLAGVVGTACSLPGLIPAVGLLRSAPSPEVAAEATWIQVHMRLRHHLDPTAFTPGAYAWYAVLLAVWLLLERWPPSRTSSLAQRRFRWIVHASALFAITGLALGWWPVVAQWLGYRVTFPVDSLLKFYPFRLFDALLPLAIVLTVARSVVRVLPCKVVPLPSLARWLVATLVMAGLALSPSPLNSRPGDPRLDAALRNDWNVVCDWIRHNTPTEAMFVTPTFGWEFKWRASRAEYFSPKDCPQDAAGIVEWRRRAEYWRAWRREAFGEGLTRDELRRLSRETGAAYLVIHKEIPVEPPPAHVTDKFAVYALRDAD